MVPVEKRGAKNESVTENGTVPVVIQSDCACAGPWPNTAPSPSNIFTGNDASKNQLPRTVPVATKGDVIIVLSEGNATEMLPSGDDIVMDDPTETIGDWAFFDGIKKRATRRIKMTTAKPIATYRIVFSMMVGYCIAPSLRRISFFIFTPRLYPPSEPSDRTTRWHGIFGS